MFLIFALIGALAVGTFGFRAATGYEDPALRPPQSQANDVGKTIKPGTSAHLDSPLTLRVPSLPPDLQSNAETLSMQRL